MSRQLISSEKFPPKPHNCPAVKVPGLVFCAGQTATGEIKQATVSLHMQQYTTSNNHPDAKPSSVQRTVLQNLKEVLELAGSSLEQVVKYNVYLADMKDFAAMNEVYIDFLPKPMPSRSCLQALPPGDGTVIEIECIAQV
ncbi:protein mmf2, mitochondrial [Aspergillus lentulus]|uniref:Protein mmf2, mitochondrial n=1 Tax=Aspergillus lentulus TaxID=293939 RepID=A0AAN4PLT6_ASPLE|nr:protein mmf2, mitochondrial [Aspergillus lentulus]